jgi:hypothetical protein
MLAMVSKVWDPGCGGVKVGGRQKIEKSEAAKETYIEKPREEVPH